MRMAEERPDGTLQLQKVSRTIKDLHRYMRVRSGEATVFDIAKEENIEVDSASKSIARGSRMFEADQMQRLRDAKYEGAIENEKIRKGVREIVARKLVAAIETLLTGERSVVEVNKETGMVTIHKFTDPEVIAMGIDAARKAISLEEKASPNTVVQIQNNVGGGEAEIAAGMSVEERLEKIRAEQSNVRVPVSREVINVRATVVEPEDPDNVIVPPIGEDEEPLF